MAKLPCRTVAPPATNRRAKTRRGSKRSNICPAKRTICFARSCSGDAAQERKKLRRQAYRKPPPPVLTEVDARKDPTGRTRNLQLRKGRNPGKADPGDGRYLIAMQFASSSSVVHESHAQVHSHCRSYPRKLRQASVGHLSLASLMPSYAASGTLCARRVPLACFLEPRQRLPDNGSLNLRLRAAIA